jgi:hypothetical protein
MMVVDDLDQAQNPVSILLRLTSTQCHTGLLESLSIDRRSILINGF